MMKINKLAQQSGVSAKTIRYYEDIGLLPAAVRADNGYREYGQSSLDLLRFIRRCRDLKISIDSIRKLVKVQAFGGAPCTEVDQIVRDQLESVRGTIRELQLLEEDLARLALSCDEHNVSQCRILKSLQTPKATAL
ncbi:MAG: MerR family transcriptional regulator [Gammaproteobacteria bacterium]|nr:MerR family transcriptional regulator [Gammaproteobacteria bacterium]OGT73758.1 MAG: MerR family transcriptional regulator [Gammaproteobacteria bacterium RIFCSPLOWO2_02_FULL_57_10]